MTDVCDKYADRARSIVAGPISNQPQVSPGFERIVGFRCTEEVAGLSEALFAGEFIRKAVNNHDALVKALTQIAWMDEFLSAEAAREMMNIARETLSQLNGAVSGAQAGETPVSEAIDHELELTLARMLQIASLMERGQLTQPRKVGRELRLLEKGIRRLVGQAQDPAKKE